MPLSIRALIMLYILFNILYWYKNSNIIIIILFVLYLMPWLACTAILYYKINMSMLMLCIYYTYCIITGV